MSIKEEIIMLLEAIDDERILEQVKRMIINVTKQYMLVSLKGRDRVHIGVPGLFLIICFVELVKELFKMLPTFIRELSKS